MAEEGEQKLSKGELKRLAKKAAKDAKKNKGGDKDKGGKPAGAPANAKKGAAAAASPPKKKEAAYFLANAVDDSASLKASIASIAFGVPLARASAAQKVPSIFSGPALISALNPSIVAFGGNGTSKAISLIGSSALCPIVDEWLELERTSLRDGASAKTQAATLKKIEEVLTEGCGSFLVDEKLTLADIVIVVCLSKRENLSAPIQHYVNAHLSSAIFTKGNEALEALVPPPPFDLNNNPSLMGAVNSVFYAAIEKLVPEIVGSLGTVIEKSKVLKNGDYQCKEAMPLFARLKASGSLPEGINSPQQIAKAIVDNIPVDNPVVDSIDINGPGFILCRIKASFLNEKVNSWMNNATNGKNPTLPLPTNVANKGDTVIVDFSSPNIAKEMHVGHLRSTIIGESVCRILEYVGADVKRVNHVGDWGTQFGMLITFLKEEYPNFGKDSANGDVAIGDLTMFYKRAKVSEEIRLEHICRADFVDDLVPYIRHTLLL